MKKTLSLTLLLFAIGMQTIAAQDNMDVRKKDGTVLSTGLKDLQKITFSGDETQMNLHTRGEVITVQLSDMSYITFGPAESAPTGIATPCEVEFSMKLGNTLCIACPDGIRSVELYDAGGRQLYRATVSATQHRMPASLLPKGVTLVTVRTATAVVTRKITRK